MQKNKQILIVEDSPTMRQLLVFAVRRLKNVDIVEATDGMDGLRKVSSDHFDLALIDINMPVMDGLKLISMIRGDETLNQLPVIRDHHRGGQRRSRSRAGARRKLVLDQADPGESGARRRPGAAREKLRPCPPGCEGSSDHGLAGCHRQLAAE